MSSGDFWMEDVAKWEYGDNWIKVQPRDRNNAYSWEVTLKNGEKRGLNLDGFAKAKHGPSAYTTCNEKDAYTWNWHKPPESMVTDVQVRKNQIFSNTGTCSGKVRKKIRMKSGYSSTRNITAEIHAKICAEASAKMHCLSGSVSAEASAGLKNSLDLNFTEEVEIEDEIEINLSMPCYVYQLECSFKVGGARVTVSSHGWFITDKPI